LQKYANSKNIEFLSTAFDIDSLDFLLSLNMPVLKISSGELVNGPLLWRFGKSQKPLIISTGMSTLSEIEFALAILAHSYQNKKEPRSINEVWKCWENLSLREHITKKVTLLHCTSQYPAPYQSVNLKAINTLHKTFNTSVGYSDHTEGIIVSLAAVALGALVIEKHFTLDKNLPGPDQKVSLDVLEFSELSRQIIILELEIGSGEKKVQDCEWELRNLSRQKLIAAKNIEANRIFVREDFATTRASKGHDPNYMWELLGRVAKKSYLSGDPIDE
jgi:N-acetylneuraminate synthase